MKILLTALSGVVAIAMASPGRPQPVTTAPTSGACGETTSTACTNEQSSPDAPDLTPTQWLFGRDAFAKLTNVAQQAWVGRHLHGPDVELASSDGGGHVPRGEARPATSARVTHDTGGSLILAPNTMTASASSDASSRRYLAEEWRAAELAVADSVYHANLDRVFEVFEALERGHVAEPQRQQVLLRLNRINEANAIAWIKFRQEVNHEADSLVTAAASP